MIRSILKFLSLNKLVSEKYVNNVHALYCALNACVHENGSYQECNTLLSYFMDTPDRECDWLFFALAFHHNSLEQGKEVSTVSSFLMHFLFTSCMLVCMVRGIILHLSESSLILYVRFVIML